LQAGNRSSSWSPQTKQGLARQALEHSRACELSSRMAGGKVRVQLRMSPVSNASHIIGQTKTARSHPGNTARGRIQREQVNKTLDRKTTITEGVPAPCPWVRTGAVQGQSGRYLTDRMKNRLR
jgi:hypothetical protein